MAEGRRPAGGPPGGGPGGGPVDGPGPERTAERVALWRALHVALDAPPHVLNDEVGLQLLAPAPGWQRRPDLDPERSSRARASIVARARWIEDRLESEVAAGVGQLVLLGAGLDTVAQRRPDLVAALRIFEIDQPAPQAWKRRRLAELGLPVPDGLRFVPVDFEADQRWWAALGDAGFDAERPAMVAATGLLMYLTGEAVVALLQQLTALAPGSTAALSFMVPLDLVEPGERPGRRSTEKYARLAGNPFLSLFAPDALVALAEKAGFASVEHVSPADLTCRYFANRSDCLHPSSSEHLLVTRT